MALIDLIEKAINEHGSANIMRERLVLIREQADILQRQIVQLQQENSDLKKRLSISEHQLAAKTVMEEFVEHRGALFKRKPSGGYHFAVYCSSCQLPMGNAHPEVPFNCGRCHTITSFEGRELEKIIRELP